MAAVSGARCLVLGAGGFIGANLCDGLLAAGALVTGLGRPPRGRDPPADVAWIEGDFGDAFRLRDACAGAEVVFHLLGGGLPANSNLDPVADALGAIPPSLRLLEACRDARVRRLVFVSSGGTVYGAAGAEPIAETAATDPISAYGVGKLAIEKYIQVFHHLHGQDYAILRVANPYGPHQLPGRAQGLIGALMQKVVGGEAIEIWGDGSVVRDFLHVDDLVAAMIRVAATKGPCLYNVGSGVGRSVRSILDDVAAIAGARMPEVRYLPARAADVPVSILSIDRIARETGWRPTTSWSAGLRSTYDWVRARDVGR